MTDNGATPHPYRWTGSARRATMLQLWPAEPPPGGRGTHVPSGLIATNRDGGTRRRARQLTSQAVRAVRGMSCGIDTGLAQARRARLLAELRPGSHRGRGCRRHPGAGRFDPAVGRPQGRCRSPRARRPGRRAVPGKPARWVRRSGRAAVAPRDRADPRRWRRAAARPARHLAAGRAGARCARLLDQPLDDGPVPAPAVGGDVPVAAPR
jgi:hypothetical protein